ncbi:MAG: Co2+/Mg2+ efflux protein ApaG [Proteobacteria bacterium]|nr:Co2+/Mg2+ efflux protein ApaG [Pseudomonadota bacterium]
MGIYKKNTAGIIVDVRPEYVTGQSGITNAEDVFIWSYHVRIENNSDQTFQLISRYWKIVDKDGGIQEVNGEGVIGEKPVLTPGSKFNYSSGIHLTCPSGVMSGHYYMKGENDEVVEVQIPAFSLDVPNYKIIVN